MADNRNTEMNTNTNMNMIDIEIKNTGRPLNNRKFGIFFEDLSHAADGGLYGELVQNRSFEFEHEANPEHHALTSWEIAERGDSMISVHTEMQEPMNARNPHYLVIEAMALEQPCGVRNTGFNKGIALKAGQEYCFSCYARTRTKGEYRLLIQLENRDGTEVYASAQTKILTADWEKYELTLMSSQTDFEGRLAVLVQEPCRTELDFVSLFPKETFQNRKNGLRKDLAEMLADLKPGFLRFPGGCLVHVGSLNANDRSSQYRWKNSVLPLEERPVKRNNQWNYEQTLGLGYYEYFLLCEDLHAEPFPVIGAGYDPHYLRKAAPEDMQEWIDEALDLIEFANGDVDTKWGSVRAKLGHPERFGLQYLTIGNEETGAGYLENFEIICKAVRKAHPEIKVINSLIGANDGDIYLDGVSHAAKMGCDYADIHNYSQPEWYLTNFDRYNQSPEGVKLYIGEYSTCGETWHNALWEAALLTEFEKSESLEFACYAPLFENVDYANWTPNLIHFDNHRVYGTPSYYVQKMFMSHQGNWLLDTSDTMEVIPAKMQCLSGGISVKTAEVCAAKLWDFSVTEGADAEHAKKKSHPEAIELPPQTQSPELARTTTGTYKIEFSFCRTQGGGFLGSRGKSAITVSFAEENGEKLEWTIDGWQRLTGLNGRNGYSKTVYNMSLETGKSYCAKIEVCDGIACTYLRELEPSNGEQSNNERTANKQTNDEWTLINVIVCRKLVLKPLYYSAVRLEDGSIAIRLANLEKTKKTVRIHLDSYLNSFENQTEKMEYTQYTQAKMSYLAGYQPEETNSLEEPHRVYPKEKLVSVEDNQLTIPMPEESAVLLLLSHNR